MKALTLTQPWASLAQLGAKNIETRSWATSYRGPLAIHAGKGLGPVGGVIGLGAQCSVEPFWSVLHGAGCHRSDQLPRGAIVAVAELITCVPTVSARYIGGDEEGWSTEIRGQRWPLSAQERAFGDYSPGRYAWLLANVLPLRIPVPARGAQGLWNVPAEVVAQIEAQL